MSTFRPEEVKTINDKMEKKQFNLLKSKEWTYVSCKPDHFGLTIKVLEKYAKNIKWNYLTWNCSNEYLKKNVFTLIEKFGKHFDKTVWSNITDRYFLTHLDEIEDYLDNVSWWKISRHGNLTEDFMRMHTDYLDWKVVSRWQKMGAQFIEEFADKLDWKELSDNKKVKTADLSKVGKNLKMVAKTNYKNANFYNKKVDESVLEAHEDEIDWNRLSCSKRKLSPEFLNNHKFDINWKGYITLHTIDKDTLKMAVKCKLIKKSDLKEIVKNLKRGDHISWGGSYYSTKPEKSRAAKLEKLINKI